MDPAQINPSASMLMASNRYDLMPVSTAMRSTADGAADAAHKMHAEPPIIPSRKTATIASGRCAHALGADGWRMVVVRRSVAAGLFIPLMLADAHCAPNIPLPPRAETAVAGAELAARF